MNIKFEENIMSMSDISEATRDDANIRNQEPRTFSVTRRENGGAVRTHKVHPKPRDPENPDYWRVAETQCPYCEGEFDGVPVLTARAYREDIEAPDTICARCTNEARSYELTTLDFALYDSKTRPTHLIRWEYRPSEWAELHDDPDSFYSRTWQFGSGTIHQDSPEFGLIAHGIAASGASRLLIPGMKLTARVYDES